MPQDGKAHEVNAHNASWIYGVAQPVVVHLSEQLKDLLLKLESGDDWIECCGEPWAKVYLAGKKSPKIKAAE
jgi:hypothetical protein